MESIKISIIVPVYNVENYLEQCLNSLVNQTLKDIEIIIINDGSIDKSGIIINKYKENYNNIVVINTNNIGAGSARNLGIEKAVGEYIAFVDADDFIELEMYEKLYNIAINSESDIVISGINYHYDDVKKYEEKILENDEKIEFYDRDEALKRFFLGSFTIYSWNKIYSKRIFSNLDVRYSKDISTGEDIIIALTTINLAKKIASTNIKLYNYRQRRGSITSLPTKQKIIDNIHMIINSITYSKEKIEDIDESYIIYYDIRNLITMFIEYVKIMRFDRKEIYKNINGVFGELENKFSFESIIECRYLSKMDKIRYILFKLKILDIYILLRVRKITV